MTKFYKICENDKKNVVIQQSLRVFKSKII